MSSSSYPLYCIRGERHETALAATAASHILMVGQEIIGLHNGPACAHSGHSEEAGSSAIAWRSIP